LAVLPIRSVSRISEFSSSTAARDGRSFPCRPFRATLIIMAKTKLREEMIRVRFTADELAITRSRAKAEGVPVSTYLRRLAITTRLAPSESEAKVKRALATLGSLSSKEANELRENVREVREGWTRGRR
jgi:NaMN:DMB phosphoribosyltransferase